MSKSKPPHDRQSVDQSALVSGPVTNFSFSLKFSIDSWGFVILWRPLSWEDEFIIYCWHWATLAQSFSGPSPAGLNTMFNYPIFWDSPNLEGQVPVLMSPGHWVPFSSPLTTRRATVEVFWIGWNCSNHAMFRTSWRQIWRYSAV
jgi:hypothetical protein